MTDPFTDIFGRDRSDDHAVSLDSAGVVIPWQRFQLDVSTLATQLSVSEEKRWALCFADSYWFAVSFFAAALSGKELVIPGNIISPKALSSIKSHYDAMLSDLPLVVDCPLLTPETGTVPGHTPECFLSEVRITLFTSGSTSGAKAVHKTFKELAAEVAVLKTLFGEFLAGREVFATVSHQHIYGLLFRVLLPLTAGAPFAASRLDYPDQVARFSSGNRVLVASPALLKRLSLEQVECGYQKVFSSGGPLSFDSAQQCAQLFGDLPIEVYGSSESGGVGWREQRTAEEPWQPFPGITTRCGEGDRLSIRSPFIAQDDWYETDDRVTLLPNGAFRLIGRADRVVKVSEKRISLVEVEECLQRFVTIDEAVVLPLQGPERQELGAVIRLSDEGIATLNQVGKQRFITTTRRSLVEHIDPVGVPRRFRFLDVIPVNSQGKYEVNHLEGLFL